MTPPHKSTVTEGVSDEAFWPGPLSGMPWHSGCSLDDIESFEKYRGRTADGYTMWGLHQTWDQTPSFKGGWPTLNNKPVRLSIALAPLPETHSAAKNHEQWGRVAKGDYDRVYSEFSQKLAESGRNQTVVIDWTNLKKKGAQKFSILETYPGDDWVGIVGVDYYDGWPALNDEKIWGRQYNRPYKGGSCGIGAWPGDLNPLSSAKYKQLWCKV